MFESVGFDSVEILLAPWSAMNPPHPKSGVSSYRFERQLAVIFTTEHVSAPTEKVNKFSKES